MTAWWYSENNKNIGPVEEDALVALLQSGKISHQTLLWREGYASWQPFAEIRELAFLKHVIPPSADLKPVAPPLIYTTAGRWQRYFARIFDLWLELLIVTFVSGYILGQVSSTFIEFVNNANAHLIGIIYLPFGLVLDAVLYHFFGNTPGKAILGIKVVKNIDLPLTSREYLKRNFSLWGSGLAFGLPLINLFTMSKQFGRLKKGEAASYDLAGDFAVKARPLAVWKWLLFTILFVSLFAVVLYLNFKEKEFQVRHSGVAANYHWINPVTNNRATINSIWGSSEKKNPEGQTFYMFTEQAQHAVIVFAVEEVPGITLEQYVQVFIHNASQNMQFWNGGTYDLKGVNQRWQGWGAMLDDKNNRFRVELIHNEDRVWRIVSIQSRPYEYSDAMVDKLKSELWKTAL
ncbi:RDD family protein [Methylophilus luteus]|uniref:RDD family protein n=1 Tax=Methylophilus luteus TaxID=640108 RepID=A0ABW3F3Z7_9PROT